MPDQNINQAPSVEQQINPQPTTPPHKKSHGLGVILFIVFVSLASAAGFFGYKYWQLKKQMEETPQTQTQEEQNQVAQPEETDPTADWQTYTNDEYGFEFKYPEDWFLKTEKYGSSLTNFDTSKNFDETNKTRFSVSLISPNFNQDLSKEYFDEINKEFAKTGGAPSPARFISEATIDGHKAALVDWPLPGILSGESEVYFAVNNKNQLLEIRMQVGVDTNKKDFQTTFDQILSTFRFLQTGGKNNKNKLTVAVNNYLQALINHNKSIAEKYLTEAVRNSGELDSGWISLYDNYQTYEVLNEFHSEEEENNFYNQDEIHLNIKMYQENDPHGHKAEIVWVKEADQWKTLTWYLFP